MESEFSIGALLLGRMPCWLCWFCWRALYELVYVLVMNKEDRLDIPWCGSTVTGRLEVPCLLLSGGTWLGVAVLFLPGVASRSLRLVIPPPFLCLPIFVIVPGLRAPTTYRKPPRARGFLFCPSVSGTHHPARCRKGS